MLAIEYNRAVGGAAGIRTKIQSASRESGTCGITECLRSNSLQQMQAPEDSSDCGIITEQNLYKCFEGKQVDTGVVQLSSFEDLTGPFYAHHALKQIRMKAQVQDKKLTLKIWERHWFYNGTNSIEKLVVDTTVGIKTAYAKRIADNSGVRYQYLHGSDNAYNDASGYHNPQQYETVDFWLPWGSVNDPNTRYLKHVIVPVATFPGPPSCFPAGALVLMADGSMQRIEEIRAGDVLMGANGAPVVVQEVDRPLLGNRRMMAMQDGSLIWSEEHAFWTADASGEQWWWAANPDRWRWEASIGHIGGLHDNATMRGGKGYAFAHLDGWKDHATEHLDCFGPDTQLYLPRTNGVPIIVNGYVVGAGVNEAEFEYKQFDWNQLRHRVLEKCYEEAA